MTIDELRSIVGEGESASVEFKRTTGRRTDGAKAVCGMLNGAGGFVVFGVTDNGEIRGQEVSTESVEDVVAELRHIEPRALLEPETVTVTDDLEVVVVRVPGGLGGGPYTYRGRAYQREGPTTVQMPQQQYERLLVERTHPARRWEIQPAHGITIDDVDHAEITRTIDEAIRRGRLEEPGTRNPEELLRGLGLIQDGQLVNAAVVLFAQPETLPAHYPQCVLRMARFRGPDKSEFEDNRQEVGNAFQLLGRAQRFFRDHLPVAGRVVPNLFEREDDPIYPPEALREALANAICHRDYSQAGGSISLGIYDDRLEITSTGGLHFGLTVEDLKRPHSSQPWNPTIANVFYLRGIIETWGRGTIRMAELNKRAGLVPPDFEERGPAVAVTFRPTEYVPPNRVSQDISDFQKELLQVLADLGPSALSSIRANLSTEAHERTVQDNLQMLRSLGLIELKGRARGARWMLAGEND